MDTLQLKYKDKLDIISVTGDKEQLVNEVLGKIFKDKRYSIKVLTENKTLNLYFPYQSIPHYVWIDNKGVIKAITSNKESLKFGMDEFLKNQQLGLQMKQDILKI